MTLGRLCPVAPAAVLLAVLGACSEDRPRFHPADNPQRLSDWNLFEVNGATLAPTRASLVFRPANPLFSDYARKLRTLWLPEGTRATLVDGVLDYPVGTVLSKTFHYPADRDGKLLQREEGAERHVELERNRLIETRLLVRRTAGWEGIAYLWNAEQTEAFRRVAGASVPLSLHGEAGQRDFIYFVPNENQCAACHQTSHPDGGLQPLGAIAAELNTAFEADADGAQSQLERLVERGWLGERPRLAVPVSWQDESAPIESRAQAYLNMQCGHCHNPDGPADTSALILDGSHQLPIHMGICKTPVAAGGGAGQLRYSIVPGAPEESILLYRMRSRELDEMMPELGRSLIHTEGIALLDAWIRAMPGACPAPAV